MYKTMLNLGLLLFLSMTVVNKVHTMESKQSNRLDTGKSHNTKSEMKYGKQEELVPFDEADVPSLQTLVACYIAEHTAAKYENVAEVFKKACRAKSVPLFNLDQNFFALNAINKKTSIRSLPPMAMILYGALYRGLWNNLTNKEQEQEMSWADLYVNAKKQASINLSNSLLKEVCLIPFTPAVIMYLDLSNNYLECLPDSIKNCVNLETLDVSGNLLNFLPNQVCQLAKLEYLNAKNNFLTRLPHDINKLNKLEELYLSRNLLSDWSSITGLSMLEKLDVSNNKLGAVPSDLAKWPKLTYLFLTEDMEVPAAVLLKITKNDDGSINEDEGIKIEFEKKKSDMREKDRHYLQKRGCLIHGSSEHVDQEWDNSAESLD